MAYSSDSHSLKSSLCATRSSSSRVNTKLGRAGRVGGGASSYQLCLCLIGCLYQLGPTNHYGRMDVSRKGRKPFHGTIDPRSNDCRGATGCLSPRGVHLWQGPRVFYAAVLRDSRAQMSAAASCGPRWACRTIVAASAGSTQPMCRPMSRTLTPVNCRDHKYPGPLSPLA